MFNTENLIFSYYEPTTDTYELEFEAVFIKDIPAELHPLARIDEWYWNEQAHINEAILQGEISFKNVNVEIISQYLETYSYTNSTELNERFHIFKSDIYGLSEAYRKGEAYVYDIEEYIDFLHDCIDEADEDEVPKWLDTIEEVDEFKDNGYRVVIDHYGNLTYI